MFAVWRNNFNNAQPLKCHNYCDNIVSTFLSPLFVVNIRRGHENSTRPTSLSGFECRRNGNFNVSNVLFFTIICIKQDNYRFNTVSALVRTYRTTLSSVTIVVCPYQSRISRGHGYISRQNVHNLD